MDDHLIFSVGEVVCNVRGVEEIVREILLDDVLLVPRADHELVVAVVAVQLHDVEENGHSAQIYHGLGLELGFLRNPGTETAGQNNDFHSAYYLSISPIHGA